MTSVGQTNTSHEQYYIHGNRSDGDAPFQLLLSKEITLGRTHKSIIPITSIYASKRHLTFRPTSDGKWEIEDLQTSNGTYLRGERIKSRKTYTLEDGDTIRIGRDQQAFNIHYSKAPPNIVARLNCHKTPLKEIIGKREQAAASCHLSSANAFPDVKLNVTQRKDPKLSEQPFVELDTVPMSKIAAKIPKGLVVDLTTLSSDDDLAVLHDETKEFKRRRDNDSPEEARIRQKIKRSGLSQSSGDHLSKEKPSVNQPRRSPRKAEASSSTCNQDETQSKKTMKLEEYKKLKGVVEQRNNKDQRQQPKVQIIRPLRQTRRDEPSTASSKPSLSEMARIPRRPAEEEPEITSKPRISHFNKFELKPSTVPSAPPPKAVVNPFVGVTSTAALLANPPPRTASSLDPRLHRPGPASKSVTKVSFDKYLEMIFKWNPIWLHESLRVKDDPPVAEGMELLKLKSSYESYEEYISTYIPYIIYEIWSSSCDAYHQVVGNRELNFGRDGIIGHIVSLDQSEKRKDKPFLQIVVEYPISESKRNFLRIPSDGDLVLVELDLLQGSDSSIGYIPNYRVFGYIHDATMQSRSSAGTKPYSIPANCLQIVKYVLDVKHAPAKFNHNVPIKLFKVEYIRPQLKHIEALLALKHSALSNDIQKPRKMTCQIPYPRDITLTSDVFNESQLIAIIGSSEAVKRAKGVPKIAFIQGPPGTGKTHTLVGIVQEIYRNWAPYDTHEFPKILICAPSNGAVDEIGKRLFAVRKFMDKEKPGRGRSLRLVRVGQDDQVRKEIQHITLDKLVANNMGVGNSHAELIAQSFEDQAAKLDIEISTLSYKGRIKEAEEKRNQMAKLVAQAERARREAQFQSGGDEQKKRAKRIEILEKADIILTTLNSCRSNLLEQVFNRNNTEAQFTCVIIDEASQCSEPELLMPLYYKSITKMILIGDPMQLPATVKSVKGQKAGYGVSFFERVFRYFGGYDSPDNIVQMLSIQFRMHPAICEFPSRQFYDGKLMTHERAGMIRNFDIRPYTVLDVTGTSENVSDYKNIHNKNEATFICTLCKFIEENIKYPMSVGIITGYQGQKRMINDKLKSMELSKITVDVNTIDGFQGQERDIIIFSSVRSTEGNGSIGFMGSNQRTNVALTRAKYALIVCISKKSMKQSDLWNSLIRDAESRNSLLEVPASASSAKVADLLLLPDADRSEPMSID